MNDCLSRTEAIKLALHCTQKNMKEEEAELRELQAKFKVDGEQHAAAKA